MPAEADDRWTVGRLLTWTREFLQKKGSESPRLDAEVLLAAVMKCQRVNLYTQYEDEVDEAHRSTFRDLGQAAGRRGAGGLSGGEERVLSGPAQRLSRRPDPSE